MQLIDTHVHFYSEEYKNDLDAVIANAKRNNVFKVLLPAIDSTTHAAMLNLAAKDPVFFRPMMGVHPTSIKANFRDELAVAEKFLNERNDWCAIGEIGLDFYHDTTFKNEQIEAFRTQIEWAVSHGLPINIHSRKANYECVEMLKEYKGKLRGVFHCFGGSLEEAKEIIKLGFLLGIGGVVTFKNAGLKTVLPQIGLEHLVLETDAPWLAPTPHRGKRNESAYIRLIADEIAQIMNKPVTEVAEITTRNAELLYKN